MKAVMLSIQPKWVELIASGKKTVEVRKTKPKIDVPFKCYIYCTKGEPLMKTKGNDCFIDKEHRQGENLYGLYEFLNGKVIGEFVCDWVVDSPIWRLRGNTGFLAPRTEKEKNLPEMACLSLDELKAYVGSENKCVCGWHITDLVIYEQPKELSEFRSYNVSTYIDEEFGLPMPTHIIKRPPQSYMFVEELKGETE